RAVRLAQQGAGRGAGGLGRGRPLDCLSPSREVPRYCARSDSMIGCRAAVRAGKKPPRTPRNPERTSAATMRPPVILKLKVISAKVLKLLVPVVMPLTGRASRQPTPPPMSASRPASIRNDSGTLDRGNPRVRSVPISRLRLLTAAYKIGRAHV